MVNENAAVLLGRALHCDNSVKLPLSKTSLGKVNNPQKVLIKVSLHCLIAASLVVRVVSLLLSTVDSTAVHIGLMNSALQWRPLYVPMYEYD